MIFEDFIARVATAAQEFTDNRVYPNLAPPNVEYPCVTVYEITKERVRDMNGHSGLCHTRFQVNCWARTYKDVRNMAQTIRLNMDNFKGTLGGSTVDAVFLIDESDTFDQSLSIDESIPYGVRMDFQVRHREAVDENT